MEKFLTVLYPVGHSMNRIHLVRKKNKEVK